MMDDGQMMYGWWMMDGLWMMDQWNPSIHHPNHLSYVVAGMLES